MLVAHTTSTGSSLLLALYFIYLAVNRAVKSQVDTGESSPVEWTARTRQGVMVMVYHGARVYILIQDTSTQSTVYVFKMFFWTLDNLFMP